MFRIKIPLAFQFTWIYLSSPHITGPTCDCLCGHSIDLAKRGKRAMVMKSGERWHCMNPACGCGVLVESNGEIEGENPRCACGGVMKRDYSPPLFRYLDFLTFPEPALAHRDTPEERRMRRQVLYHPSGAR